MSLRLSKKYGLNPTILVCFLCGEAKNEIALLGSGYKRGQKAPMHMLLDRIPCEKCKEQMKEYVAILGMLDTDIPSGEIAWIRKTVWKQLISTPPPKGGICLMLPEAFDRLRELAP